jgi:hypothetical protein
VSQHIDQTLRIENEGIHHGYTKRVLLISRRSFSDDRCHGGGHFASWWLPVVVLAVAFVPVAWFGPRRALGQFGAMILQMDPAKEMKAFSEIRMTVIHDNIGFHKDASSAHRVAGGLDKW